MSFITGTDLSVYCPGIDNNTLNKVASDVEALFCSLLPLSIGERTVSFRDDEVYFHQGWNKVNTSLLNISAVKMYGAVLDSDEYKIDGMRKNSIWFEKRPIFDPVFSVAFTSGYSDADIPFDLKEAMIQMGVDKALNIGVAGNVKAYALGPRSVTFKDEGVAVHVARILNSYLYY